MKALQSRRLLWGIVITSDKEDTIGPLFTSWDNDLKPRYDGDPTRPLLFTTRAAARRWARDRNSKHWNTDRPYRVVRVLENVEVRGTLL